ncbi:MAG: DUF2953 domain-containing protein [Lachnospiraceae bacterium]|nr:DUF2953 domain-containing protein [Lachnospiraceae bacterium]
MTLVLSIIWKILFILLIILGVLLFLLGVLLVCPIHYKVSLEKGEELFVKGVVRWLFFLVYVPFSYENSGFQFHLRIFGIEPGRRRKGKRVRKRSVRKAEKKRPEDVPSKEAVAGDDISRTEGQQERVDSPVPGAAEQQEKEDPPVSEAAEQQEKEDSPVLETAEQKEGTGKGEFKRNFSFSSIQEFFRKVKEKKDWAAEGRRFIKDENTKQTICIIKDNVVHLIKKLKPKVLKGYIEFGTGDPCQTGQALGALACLYAYYGGGVEIVPDFMEKKLLGRLYIRGRLSLLTVLLCLLRVVLSEGFGRFRKDIKELKEAL